MGSVLSLETTNQIILACFDPKNNLATFSLTCQQTYIPDKTCSHGYFGIRVICLSMRRKGLIRLEVGGGFHTNPFLRSLQDWKWRKA